MTVKAFGLLAALSTIASAQAVRGTVVDAANAPVPGVIVMLLDFRDSVTARALTNERGEFRVAASVAGSY
ncbi:MAG: carboxypeptidase-like regulatory domain-containing protein, partial [Gemmatimonadaceae bacterium]